MVCEMITNAGNRVKEGIRRQKEKIRGEIAKQKEEIIGGLIDVRESREPFFGVQTVFAKRIDKLIEERRENVKEEPEEKPATYHIKTLF
jgi:hypothetical protein